MLVLDCILPFLWIVFIVLGEVELTALSLSSLFHACAGMDAARSRAALIPAEKYILKMGFLVDGEEEELCLSEVFWMIL